MADIKTFRPIDWDGSAGTGWFNTAYSGNMKNAGTAMFYGASFEAAGWLAVFKNTESTTVKITKVKGLIGTRQSTNVKAKVICKVLGKSFTTDTAIISTENGYVTNISNSIPKKDKLSTSSDVTTVTLSKAVEVKSGEYFCIGFLGTDIPSGQYFNMALRRLTSNVKNIFYTQDANTSKTVTWYRSGNTNDNTNWKKHYAYIWAEGEVEEEKAVNPPVIKEPDPPPPPYEKSISLDVDTNSIIIPQGSETTVTVATDVTVVNNDPTGKIKKPTWEIISTNHTGFTVTKKDANTISIKSTKYDKTDLTINIKVKATSTNGTGVTKEQTIAVVATHPTINTLTVTKDVLRPTEQSTISCTYSDNAGGVTYSLDSTTYVSLLGSVITAKNRTDSETGKKVILTATTKNGGVTKSLDIAVNHWTLSDLQVALSSDTIYADSFTGADGSIISVTNASTNRLNVNYSLTKSTVLSFSNTKNQDTLNAITVSTQTPIYTYGTISKNSEDTLKACISCDTAISKNYNITLLAPVTANIKYPLGLQTGTTINLPAIARKNSTGKYEVYFSTYPIQINITNPNTRSVRVTLKEDTTELKIGAAFDNTVLEGLCWIRPETVPKTYTATKLPKELPLNYTLKVEQYIGNNSYQSVFNKTFSIKYTIYKDYSSYEASATTAADFDLISLKDQGQPLAAAKAEKTLSLARTILNQYRPITLTEIKQDNLVVNSQETVVSALVGLYDFINTINKNSHSLVIMPQHRTKLAIGQYIMADDSVETLSDGHVNPIKNNYLDLSKPTASPFREIVKAIYNLTGPIEHYTVNYKSGGKSYNISEINGISIDSLYL